MPIDPSIPLGVQPIDVAGDVARRQAGRLQAQSMQQQIEMNALKLAEAKKQASLDPAADARILQEILQETGGDLEKVPGALAKRGMFKQAIEVLEGWDKHVKATQGTEAAGFTLSPGQSRYDAQGNVIAQSPAEAAAAAQTGFTLSPGQQRFDAEGKPIAGVPERKPAGGGSEPLVAIMGPDGLPVLVPRSQAAGKRPASNREQGRPVTSGDANRMADYDSSLNDLKVLKQTVGTVAGSTGTAARVGASLPNFVTEATGLGATAKQKQAVIDRVKQVIGKALEGGVLRKEDEYKYTKILPTIGDVPSVVAAKLNGLEAAITQRRQTQLDNLADAGYDTSRFEARTQAPTGEATSGAIKVGPYTVREKK